MLKNALKMLYLIAHFQKYFTGEAPRTPPCREVRGRKSSWKIRGWGRKSSYWELYTPLGAWEVNFLNLNILIVEKLILTDISVLLILSWASVSWEPISFSLWCPILTFSFSSCSLNKLRLQIVTVILSVNINVMLIHAYSLYKSFLYPIKERRKIKH